MISTRGAADAADAAGAADADRLALLQFELTDFSATIKIAMDQRNHLVDCHRGQLARLKLQIIMIEHFKRVQVQLDQECRSTDPAPFRFDRVYPHDVLAAQLLTNFHQAVESTDGAKQWLQTQAVNRDHPVVERNAHSGLMSNWTLGTIHQIYSEGWTSLSNRSMNESCETTMPFNWGDERVVAQQVRRPSIFG